MKCPKCRESFLVSPPDKPAIPAEKVPLPAPSNFGGTMIGVSAKRDVLGTRAADPNNQTQIGLAGPRALQGNDATMIGVAPSAPQGGSGDVDLPASKASNLTHPGDTARALGLHAASPKTGKTQELPVSTPPGPASHKNTQDTAAELPAVKASRNAVAGPFAAVTPKKASRIAFSSATPSAKSEHKPAEPVAPSSPHFAEAELPAVVNKSLSNNGPGASEVDLPDLPATIGGALGGGGATSRLMKPTSPELPSARVTSRTDREPVDVFEMDLPAVFSERGPKSTDAHLPAAKPSPGSAVSKTRTSSAQPAGLAQSAPPPKAASGNNAANATTSKTVAPPKSSVIDRALGGALGEPFALDDEAVEFQLERPGSGGKLPFSNRAADDVIDLDSEGVSLESLAPSNHPPEADLPEVAGLDLPDVLGASALPALPRDLDDAGLGFGELDLPTIGRDSPRVSSERPGAEFSTKLPSFAPSEPPGSVSSQPPSFRARQDSFGDFEGVPSFAPSSGYSRPTSGRELSDPEGELFEGESFSLSDERQSSADVSRGETRVASKPPANRAAGEEYGQVNLESSLGGVDTADQDEMEFGGIPQADSEPPKGVGLEGGDKGSHPDEPVVAKVPAARQKPSKGEPGTKPARRGAKLAIAAVALAAIAGGALALVPDVGPFGVYALQDLVLKGEHEATRVRLNRAVEEARAKDGYRESVRSVQAMIEGRAGAKRFVPLQADTAAQSLALALRYGGPPTVQSTGQVLLDELRQSKVNAALFRRALVAEKVLRRDASAASDLAAMPRDLFVVTVEGEHWLAAENVDGAVTSWTEAVSIERSPWTLFGLARAYLAGNQVDAALAAAKQVLGVNPAHVGAQLLQIDGAIRAGNLDANLQPVLENVMQGTGDASPAEQALAHTLMGELDFGGGRTSKALDAYEKALAIVPGDARALVSSARALFASGRHAAALARYQSAATASPVAVAPRIGIARAQLALEQLDQAVAQIQALRTAEPRDIEVAYLAGVAALAGGELESGRKVLQEAIDFSKQPAPPRLSQREFQHVAVEAYVALATSFNKAGEPERATPILAQAASELPSSASLRLAMGDVSFGQGQYENALVEYTNARQLAPNDTAALFKVGQAMSRLRRFEEATAVFDEVSKFDASYPGLPLERGLVLDKSGKTAEALSEYERALEHDPSDVDIQLRVGCGRVEAGKGGDAAAILKDVLSKRPKSAEANYCLGRAMFSLGNNVEALRLMRSAVEYEANNALYRLHHGWVASDMGQVAVARRELNRALELDQGAVDAYWQRGVLNLKQGAARDATLDFKKALELNPSHLAANADMAQALSQLGKENEALPYWEKAIAGDGNNPTWLFRYGKVLIGRHQGAKGAELLIRALQQVEGQSPQPGWLWQAHYLVALGLGARAEAAQHWRRYLELSPHDSPYRGEAKRALARLGQPWEGQ